MPSAADSAATMERFAALLAEVRPTKRAREDSRERAAVTRARLQVEPPSPTPLQLQEALERENAGWDLAMLNWKRVTKGKPVLDQNKGAC